MSDNYISMNVDEVYYLCNKCIYFILGMRALKNKLEIKKYFKIRSRWYNKIILNLFNRYDKISFKDVYRFLEKTEKFFPSIYAYGDLDKLKSLRNQCELALKNNVEKIEVSSDTCRILTSIYRNPIDRFKKIRNYLRRNKPLWLK